MKKIFLIMAVLMLATPALAVTIDISAVQVGDTNQVEILYETDGNLPRAFGLNISVTDGNIVDCVADITGESTGAAPGYGIFPESFGLYIDANNPNWSDPCYTPVAPGDAPGAQGTGLDTNTIVVEIGSLYYPATGLASANSPDTSGLLCTIIVTADCTVNIVGNAARTGEASPTGRGVVMENVAETPAVNFIPGTVTGLEQCFPGDHPDYAMWLKAGSPPCWCNEFQCKGDADGGFTGKDVYGQRQWVTLPDLDIFNAAWLKYDDATWAANPSWICADSDHGFDGKDVDGQRQWVTLDDLNIFNTGWLVYDNNDVFTTNPCFP